MRLLSFLAAALAVPAAVADSAPEEALERSVIEVSPTTGRAFNSLVVDNSLGDVRIEGHDSPDVVIMAAKRAPDREALERVKVSLVPDPRGPVSVRTRLVAGLESRPVPAGTIRVDLVIRVPRTALVRARTWNGGIEVEGVENGADVSANEGLIAITRVMGAVMARNAQGRQHLVDVMGDVSARALYGDVELDWIRGKRLEAVVHKGAIVARRIESRHVSLRSMRGDVRLEINPALVRDLRIRALRGDVRVVSSSAPVRVEAYSKRGQVSLAKTLAPSRRSDGRWIGSAGSQAEPAKVAIHTGLGDVVFAVQQD